MTVKTINKTFKQVGIWYACSYITSFRKLYQVLYSLRHWWIIGLNDLLVTYNDNDILLTTTYHENANLSCYDPITPPIPMAADTLDEAKLECSNDVLCTRFYSRCALSPNPPAQKYYKCTTATNVIGSSGCGSKLFERVANTEGTIPRFILSMLDKCTRIMN